MAIITLDLSQPWNMVQSLNRWLEILEGHVMGVLSQMPPGVVDDLKNYRKQLNAFSS